MNEKMMAWTDETLVGEYVLNLMLWRDTGDQDTDNLRACYERSHEIEEVAKARGIDLESERAAWDDDRLREWLRK